MKLKRFFSLTSLCSIGLLTIPVVLSSCSHQDEDADVPYIDNLDQWFSWDIDNGGIRIDHLRYVNQELADFKFHHTYLVNGQQLVIKELHDAAFAYNNLHIVDLSETEISEIPYCCFYSNLRLKKVILPTTCDILGESAFSMSGIEEIDLSNIERIDDSCFNTAFHLKYANITNKLTILGQYVFDCCYSLKRIDWNSDMNITRNCFANCTGLEVFDASHTNITSVGDMAFMECVNLETILLPNTVRSIGVACFDMCGLKSFTFPSSYQLPNFDANNGIANMFAETEINNWNLNGLTCFQVDDQGCLLVQSPGQSNFDTLYSVNQRLQSYTIPTNIHYLIGQSLTSGNLININTAEGVEFYVDQPNWNYSWGCDIQGVHFHCSITNVDFSKATMPIFPYAAFMGDALINDVKLPENFSIEKFEDKCFNYSSLSSLSFLRPYSDNGEKIAMGSQVFTGCPIANIDPQDIKCFIEGDDGLPVNTFGFNTALINLDWDETSFAGIDQDKLAVNNLHALFTTCTNLQTVDISALTTVDELSLTFDHCDSLTSVTLPSGDIALNRLADTFNNCISLESIHLPSNIYDLDQTFFHCDNLKDLTIDAVGPHNDFFEITEGTFYSCPLLERIDFPNATDQVPSGLTPDSFNYFGDGNSPHVKPISIHIPTGVSKTNWEAIFPSDQNFTIEQGF